MMDFKYNGQPVVGDSWKRANSIVIYNDYGQLPRVMFIEEKVVEVEDGVLRRPAGELTVLIDPARATESFPILNPDGTVSDQTATVAQLAALLTSAYVHFADERDYLEAQRLDEIREAEKAAQEVKEAGEDDPEETDPVPDEDQVDAIEEPIAEETGGDEPIDPV